MGITFRKMPPFHYEPRENKNANRWINTNSPNLRPIELIKIDHDRFSNLHSLIKDRPAYFYTVFWFLHRRFLHGHASMRKEIGSWFERDMENSFSIKVELEGRWWLISTFAPIFTTLFHSSVCIYRCCRFNTTWSHLLFRIAGWMIFAEEMAWNYRFVGFQNISSWNFWTAMEIAWFLIRLFALKICNSFVEEVCWFLYL